MFSHRFQRIARLSVIVAAFLAAGCYTYQPVGALRATDRLPSDVRVYRYTGGVVEFATSRIAADTIYGRAFRGAPDETKIPLAHVDSIVYRKIEPRRTAMFMVGVVALFVFTFEYISANAPSDADPFP